MQKNLKIKYAAVGMGSSIAIFLFFGIVTALIPTAWFTRMTQKTVLDYFFLSASSLLLGSYIAIYLYKNFLFLFLKLVPFYMFIIA